MKKIILSQFLFCLILFTSIKLNAITITSNGTGGGSWTTGSTWIGGTAPVAGNDVIIQSGDVVTWNVDIFCNNLTVTGTFRGLASAKVSTISGSYTVSGIEMGLGTILFSGTGNMTITGTVGLSSPKWNFGGSTTILSPSVISKSLLTINNGGSITNQATVSATTVSTPFTSATFINGTNGSLTLNQSGFMSGKTFTANATGNTVTINYATGDIPTTTSGYYNLVIGGTGTKTLPSNTVVAKDLTINANSTLNSNIKDLSVGGNWTNNGTFTASTSHVVTFNGTSAQTIATSSGSTTFEQLTINNTSGVQITSGTYLLNDVLTNNNGNFNTNGNSFTLVSDFSKTARIAKVTGTGSFSGNFIIQRFVTSRNATWADLASPVASTTFSDWENELYAVSYSYSPPSAYPTQVTYSEPFDNYVYTITPSTTLTPGKGFEVYVSGDFSYATFPATTINVVGVPNKGNQSLSSLVSYSSGTSHYNLVGNPFASSILWDSVLAASSKLSSTYDIYDASIANYSTFGAGTEIGSGQGFWVITTGTSPTFNIKETAKTTSSNSSIKKGVVEPYLILKLSSTDIQNTFAHVLKIKATTDAIDGWDNLDHPYRKSPEKLAPSITCLIDGNKAVINSFNSSNESYSIPLYTTVGITGEYKIDASGFDNMSEYACIKLEDKLLNKVIDLKNENSYSFKLNASDNADRFIVHFNRNADCSIATNINNLSPNFSNQVEILPTAQGNVINFNLSETTNTIISVTNLLGQEIISSMNVSANNQSLNLNLPENYSGLYVVKINSEKGTVIKKFVRK